MKFLSVWLVKYSCGRYEDAHTKQFQFAKTDQNAIIVTIGTSVDEVHHELEQALGDSARPLLIIEAKWIGRSTN